MVYGLMYNPIIHRLKTIIEQKERSELGDIHKLSWQWLCEHANPFNPNAYPITLLIDEDMKEWYAALTDATYAHLEMCDVIGLSQNDDDPFGFIKARLSWDLKDLDVTPIYIGKHNFDQLRTPNQLVMKTVEETIIPALKNEIIKEHDYINNFVVIDSYGDVNEYPHMKYAYSLGVNTFARELKRRYFKNE